MRAARWQEHYYDVATGESAVVNSGNRVYYARKFCEPEVAKKLLAKAGPGAQAAAAAEEEEEDL